jgi:hypothetical protein
MESHLAEKNRMVAKFEEETENYTKYYDFYHDNCEKLNDMAGTILDYVKDKKKMEDQIKQMQMKFNVQSQSQHSSTPSISANCSK